MKKFIMFLCAVSLVFGVVGVAGAALIQYDFDSLAAYPDVDWAESIYADTEFSDLFCGVTFDNTGVNAQGGSNFQVLLSDLSGIGWPTLEGDFSGNVIVNRPSQYSTIATFDYLTNFVSVTMGDYGGDEDVIYLYAYDADDNLIVYDSGTVPSGSKEGYTLSVSSATYNISWVEFYGVDADNSSIVWDNFAFNNPVPEPATMLLVGTGLIGLAGLGRKKFFKKS